MHIIKQILNYNAIQRLHLMFMQIFSIALVKYCLNY